MPSLLVTASLNLLSCIGFLCERCVPIKVVFCLLHVNIIELGKAVHKERHSLEGSWGAL